MGHTHVLTGVGVWLAASPLLPGMSAPELAASTLVCGGAAMLPDIDHDDATIARTWWPVGPLVSRLVNVAAGGHREGTHSLLFAGLAGVGAAACLWSTTAVAVLVGVFVGLAVAGFATGLFWRRWLSGAALPVTALAGFVTWRLLDEGTLHRGEFWWLPAAITLGCVVHVAGDWCTVYGVPWLWPWRRRRHALDLFVTQSAVERGPVTVALTLVVVALVGWRAGVWALFVPDGTDQVAR